MRSEKEIKARIEDLSAEAESRRSKQKSYWRSKINELKWVLEDDKE